VVNHDLRCGLTAANGRIELPVDERALCVCAGVAEIRRVGGVDRELSLNPARLQALGITAKQVNDKFAPST